MTDPYETLGLDRSASAQDVKARFKKLARKHHPDLHPGDAGAEGRFKDITTANDLLGDPERRRRFDAGEIDPAGVERPRRQTYRDFAEAPAAGTHAAQDGFGSREDLDAFLRQAFGSGSRSRGGPARGEDLSYALPVDFLDAVNGASRAITLPDGRTLNVVIPEGSSDRQMLRLKGQGGRGFDGGSPGDAFVELHVAPHAFFRRRDDDILLEAPVTLHEAVLGGRIDVPTISGIVSLAVPKGAAMGPALRLRGKGALNPRTGARGHQFVTLKLQPPGGDEPELEAFLQGWTPRETRNPRREMTP